MTGSDAKMFVRVTGVTKRHNPLLTDNESRSAPPLTCQRGDTWRPSIWVKTGFLPPPAEQRAASDAWLAGLVVVVVVLGERNVQDKCRAACAGPLVLAGGGEREAECLHMAEPVVVAPLSQSQPAPSCAANQRPSWASSPDPDLAPPTFSLKLTAGRETLVPGRVGCKFK